MKTLTYDVQLSWDYRNKTWGASCQNPPRPSFVSYKTRENVLLSVYRTIFDDLRKDNQQHPVGDSFELHVNIIEPGIFTLVRDAALEAKL